MRYDRAGPEVDADALMPRHGSFSHAAALGTLLLLTLAVWSALTEVEIVITAPAAARPAAGTAELRAPDTRAVARVLVQEGQRVTSGDAIVVLDRALLETQRHSAEQALAERRRALADSRAVWQLLDRGAPADEASTPRARLRLVEHRSRLAQHDDEIAALEAELDAARLRAAAARRLLAIRTERHRAVESASAQGALSRFDLLAAAQDRLTQRVAFDDAVGRVGVLRKRIAAQRSARRGVAAGFRQSLLERAAVLEVETAELETRLAEVDEQRRQARITTPVDGVVDRLLVAAGDFVQRGEVLGVVVPVDAAITFEARIATAQAAFLHAGQACRIKLDALPFARYGALPCTLVLIGSDVVSPDDGPGYYLAKVRPAARRLWVDGQAVPLQPGATGWVDIIAGTRTVLSFVTEPLTRFTRESLRER